MLNKLRQRRRAILFLLSSDKPEPAPYPVFLKCDPFVDSGFLFFKVHFALTHCVQNFARVPAKAPEHRVTPPHPLLQLCAIIAFLAQPRRVLQNVPPLPVIPRPVVVVGSNAKLWPQMCANYFSASVLCLSQ